MKQPREGPDAHEIAQMLNADAATLARTLLPNGKEFGGFFNVGSVRGEPGSSLKIRTKGIKQGAWADYSRAPTDPEGKGDMLRLVQLTIAGGDMVEAIRWSKGWLGIETLDRGRLELWRDRAAKAKAKAERAAADGNERKRRNAVGLWHNSEPLHGSPAQRYLEGRGIDFGVLGGFPGALRFHRAVWSGELRCKLPAMVSLFVGGADAKPKAAHVTYLARTAAGWVKEPRLDAAKVIWSPAYWGAHIPLNKGASGDMTLRDVPTGTPLFDAEGIEDGLSVAMELREERIVASGTMGNIGQLILPDAVRTLTLIEQNDHIVREMRAKAARARGDAEAAERELHALAQIDATKEANIAQHQAAGRSVLRMWPEPGFKDFNDQLRGVRMEGI